MNTITRARLIEAVEAGIQNADKTNFLTEAEKLALRHVARTATVVASGMFTDKLANGNECGCPLHQAGVDWQSPSEQDRNFGLFYTPYDRRMPVMGSMRVVG